MTKYLVTGGAGFIGSALVYELVTREQSVRVLDNLSTGRRENLAPVEEKVEFVQGDLCDPVAVAAALEGVDVVFHQAAIPSVPKSIADPIETNRANVDGTLSLLWAAKRARVRRVVYAASSSAYGDTPSMPKTENMTPNPISPYAISKLVGEFYCRIFTQVYGLETVALRYFNVFGPRQDPSSPYSGVLSLFITALLEGQRPVIYGDGEQSRDFTYVSNVVQANLLAAGAQGVAGRVFNVGTGQSHTLNQTLTLLGKITGVTPRPSYQPMRAGDVRDSLADISMARGSLGYQPEVGFEEGLRRTVDWYQDASQTAAIA